MAQAGKKPYTSTLAPQILRYGFEKIILTVPGPVNIRTRKNFALIKDL